MNEKRIHTLITGVSSGIGRELARALCLRNHLVAGVARRGDRLQALADEHQGGFEPMQTDLTDPEQRAQLVDTFLDRYGPPDYLILNAGLAHYGCLHLTSADQVDEQIELNVTAVIDITRRFLPSLLRAERGRIIIISSVLGLGAIPFASVYSASKHAVNGFVRGLRLDLRGTGISVSAVCPSGVQTEFSTAASGDASLRRSGQEPVERVAAGILRKLDRDAFIIYPTFMSALRGSALRYAGSLIDWALSTMARSRFENELPRGRIEG